MGSAGKPRAPSQRPVLAALRSRPTPLGSGRSDATVTMLSRHHCFQSPTMSYARKKKTTEQITDVSRGNTAAVVVIDQFHLKLSTLTIIENAHNTADMKYSVYPVAVKSKDRRDSIRNCGLRHCPRYTGARTREGRGWPDSDVTTDKRQTVFRQTCFQ